jgi:hypothetical protein
MAVTTPVLRAYAFNQTTGVIGANVDAGGTLSSLQYHVQRAGKVIALLSVTPFVRGYTFAAGVWSAQWANPAVLPTGTPNYGGINDDASAVYYSDNSVPNSPQAYVLNAASFGAKVTPTGVDTSFSLGSGGIPWPFNNRGDVAFYTGAPTIAMGLFGDPAGTALLSGQMTTITKTMANNCQSVYIMDSFSKSGSTVTRQYDISLDGGATWNLNVPVGVTTLMPVPGSQLKVRITMARTATGQTGQLFWFNVWAG